MDKNTVSNSITKNKGCFISLEGIEGSGKSQLQAFLSIALTQRGFNIVSTREPGATKLGKTLRSLLLEPNSNSISNIAELFLFAADRAQHISEVIGPALTNGSVVLCDRFIHSTLAYQGYARGIDLNLLHNINHIATNGLYPDLVILLDLDPAIGLKRAKDREVVKKSNSSTNSALSYDDLSWNRFEQEKLDFHNNIRNGFLELTKDSKFNIVTIDASMEIHCVHQNALNAVMSFLSEFYK